MSRCCLVIWPLDSNTAQHLASTQYDQADRANAHSYRGISRLCARRPARHFSCQCSHRIGYMRTGEHMGVRRFLAQVGLALALVLGAAVGPMHTLATTAGLDIGVADFAYRGLSTPT